MREFKFRGKRNATDEWIYGCLYGFWAIEAKTPAGLTAYSVVPETIGQYTGLKDKDGNPVYEGDIVDCDYILYDPWDDGKESLDPMRCVVEYNYFGFIFKKEEDLSYLLHDVTNIKVIGNIHDNPELMEGGAA